MPVYFNHFITLLTITLLTSVTYFYFNWRYFDLVTACLQLPRMHKLPVAGAFFINYLLFSICSILEFNLIVNWSAFFLFLFAETFFCCGRKGRCALLFSLIGILCGLAVNIFCRCVIAIATVQPLINFDNHVSSAANLKQIPVCLGFLLGGLAFRLLMLPQSVRRVRTLAAHPRHLDFLLEVLGGMFAYLSLNLLICHTENNGVLLKLWGVKSCVFVLIGSYLGVRYSLEMCALSDYRDQNRLIRRELLQKAEEEEKLRDAAYRDVMTGCFNRQYIEEAVARLMRAGGRFALCFADLDGLKTVNDRQGHIAGDRYLMAAAEELGNACRRGRDLLARYGGDEFLIVFRDISAETAGDRLRGVNDALQRRSRGEAFSMSLSYGAAESSAAAGPEELIRLADAQMYERKKSKRAR